MQKKNLLGGALLLLCTLFVFTGCKEMMSSLDNPVSAYLKITEPAKTIAKSESFSVKDCYTTISDATPKFTTSAENIATVDANGKVKGISAGKAIITIEIPATNYYEAATGQVEVTVDALLAIDAFNLHFPSDAKKTKNLFTDYHLSTKSDAAIQLAASEGSDKVFTLDPNTGDITPVHSGNGSITISVPATASYVAEEMTVDVKVRVQDRTQLDDEVADGAEIWLDGMIDGWIDMSTPLDLSGKKVTITSDKDSPATIKIKKAFIVNSDFSLSNVVIDASELVYNSDGDATKAIVLMATLPAGTTQMDIDAIKFDNVVVKSLDASLINCYGGSRKYFIKNLTINNSIIGLGGSKYVLDFQNGGNIADITISNSTLWAPSTKKHTSRIFQNQSAATISSLGGSTFTYTIENSTLYNISNGHNYVNYLRQNNQTWITYNVKNNIIVDCQRSGSFIRGINGNSNDNDCKCTWNVDNNMINYEGSDVREAEVTNMNTDKYADKNPRVKNCIAGTVTFADADKGDFSQTGVNAGDPRWKK